MAWYNMLIIVFFSNPSQIVLWKVGMFASNCNSQHNWRDAINCHFWNTIWNLNSKASGSLHSPFFKYLKKRHNWATRSDCIELTAAALKAFFVSSRCFLRCVCLGSSSFTSSPRCLNSSSISFFLRCSDSSFSCRCKIKHELYTTHWFQHCLCLLRPN